MSILSCPRCSLSLRPTCIIGSNNADLVREKHRESRERGPEVRERGTHCECGGIGGGGGVVRNSKPLEIGNCSYPPSNGIQFKKIIKNSNKTAGDKVKGAYKGYISLTQTYQLKPRVQFATGKGRKKGNNATSQNLEEDGDLDFGIGKPRG
ncbi:hypothetical protein QR685DRAFT_567729 [Neurospora intermedia]|uniref:Uncharacterized protein n=1 Tax=Neurospora intermedia TaxID=5142 RepID=A0ABR3DRA3_NEUIN